jgi:hypothetical protein
MTDRHEDLPLRSLILVPAIITLAVTLLRLAGELLRWSPTFFNREAGGPGAIVGIVWLVPVFGIYSPGSSSRRVTDPRAWAARSGSRCSPSS